PYATLFRSTLSRRRSSGQGLVEEFSAIRGLLEELDYVRDWALTARGQRLRRLYNESDLLLAECIEHGAFYALDPAETAALLSVFVYEPRTDQVSPAEWPTEELAGRWAMRSEERRVGEGCDEGRTR